MPKKEILNPDAAKPNPNLSPSTPSGNLVFASGPTGRHPVTGELGKDMREQTRNILERIKLILTAAGTSLDNVLTATTYLTRVQELAAYNEEYAKYFPTNKPADHGDGRRAEFARSHGRDHGHRVHSELTLLREEND